MADKKEIGKRLKEVFTYLKTKKRVSQKDIAENLKMTPANITEMIGGRSHINSNLLDYLKDNYNINKEWVLEGKGEMLLSGPESTGKSNARDLGIPVSILTTKSGNEFVELSEGNYLMYTRLVPIKAHASYLVGWGDDEFIGDLPIHPVVVQELHKGHYRTFEAAGMSMDDGTDQAIKEGDKLTGRLINRSLWRDKFHISRYPDYIIVHKTEGVLVKRIIEHDTRAGVIKCRSINPDKDHFPDFELNLDDCLQIYNVVIITRSRQNIAA